MARGRGCGLGHSGDRHEVDEPLVSGLQVDAERDEPGVDMVVVWLLLAWLLVATVFGIVVGRCIRAGLSGPEAAAGLPTESFRGAPAAQQVA